MQKLIYILDDETEIRKSLRVILEDEDYSVEDFANGKALLKALSKERPSLVLLDVWVGKEDGLTILDECKKLYPGLPIVMISGHGTIELAVNATKKGAVDFLEKPLSIEKVIQTIESALEKQRILKFLNSNWKWTKFWVNLLPSRELSLPSFKQHKPMPVSLFLVKMEQEKS